MATNEIIITESYIDWDFLSYINMEQLLYDRSKSIQRQRKQEHEKTNAYSYLQLERSNHENTKKKMIELQNQVELLQRYLENIKHIKFKS